MAGDAFLVLLYHRIGTPAPGQDPRLFVGTGMFDRQLAFLRKRRTYFLNLAETIDFLQGRAPLPPRSVLITFDDGFLDTFENAFPVLQKHNARATTFLTTTFVGRSFRWHDDECTFMTREQVVEMRSHGHDFGSHTVTHPNLTRLKPAKIVEEIAGSRTVLQALLQQDIRALAYPYGSYDARSKESTATAGYGCAFALHRGVNTRATDSFELRRMRVPDSMTGFIKLLFVAPLIEFLRKFKR